MTEEELHRPASCGELFRVFTLLALQGFGGVLAVAQRELVERQRWLSAEQFVELLSISQVLPGPNIVNLSLMVGDRFFGLRGAFTALAGMLAVPLLIVLGLTVTYNHFSGIAQVSGALRGMGAVAAGLVVATALKLLPTLKRNRLGLPLGMAFAGLTFLAVAVFRLPLLSVIATIGAVAVLAAWRRFPP
jgi:chromate transporter